MSLATKQNLLQTLHCARIALYYKDVAGRYQFINEAGARMLNSSVDVVTASDDHDLFARRTADVIRMRDMHTASINDTVAYECHSLLLGEDEPRMFYSVKRPMRTAHGAAAGLVGLSIRGDRAPELFEDTSLLLVALVKLDVEELMSICRRGARLKLI